MSPAARTLTVAELARVVSGTVRGDGAAILAGMAPLESATPDHASFLARADHRAKAERTAAGCVLVASADELPGRTVVVVEDPYRAFALAMGAFSPDAARESGVHRSAVVDSDARVHATAHVGPCVVLERGVRVGARSAVLAGAFVGEGSEMGEDSVLHPGVVLYPGTVVGSRVVVHARAVLGSDGFGYSSGRDGHVKIPHRGRVVVEDDVEIGAGTCVDRGAMGDTRIGRGTKIDNLVQVGHNVDVGAACLLVAQSGISGSTTLADGVVLAGQSGVAGHLTVGAGARIAAKSAVLQDVEPGATVGGIPAIPLAAWKRAALMFTKLPDLFRRVRAIEGKSEEP